MARMPGTVWVGEHSPETRMTRYDIVCVHTIVGYAPAHAAHFSVKADGTILQSRDTAFRSAANLNGNHRIIAIENEDHGSRFGGTPKLPGWVALTPEQVAANARILRWAHEEHGVPLQLCPNSRTTSRGLAYHRQGIDGNFSGYRFPGRVAGGEIWTSSFGKVCPTDVRIAQLPQILDRARSTSPEEDIMATTQELSDLLDKKLAPIRRILAASREREVQIRRRTIAIGTALDVLAETVADDATKAQARRIRKDLADLAATLDEDVDAPFPADA